MATKVSAEVTVTDQTDATAIRAWFHAQTSSVTPSAPTTTDATATPSGWTLAEPTVSSASDLSKYVYRCEQLVWGDGTCDWGTVTMSASYEAAKVAYNEALAAKRVATDYITESQDGIMVHPEGDSTTGWSIRDAIELLRSGTSMLWAGLVSNSARLRLGLANAAHVIVGSSGMEVFRSSSASVAQFGKAVRIGENGSPRMLINGNGLLGMDGSDNAEFVVGLDGAEVVTRMHMDLASNTGYASIQKVGTSMTSTSATVTLPSGVISSGSDVVLSMHVYLRVKQSSSSQYVVSNYDTQATFTYGVASTHSIYQYMDVVYDGSTSMVISYNHGTITQYEYDIVVTPKFYDFDGTTNASYLTLGNRGYDGNGAFTATLGEGLSASSRDQTAIGKYNDNQSTNAFEVGNGTDGNSKSNAFAVRWDGGVDTAGDVRDMSGNLRYAPIAHGSLTKLSSTLTLSTSAQKLPLGGTFVGNGCSASSSGIKVAQAGTYIIYGSAYLGTGYAANDIVHLLVHVNSTEVCDCLYRAAGTNPYQTVETTPIIQQLSANSVVTLHGYNQIAARGTINTKTGHGIKVIRIA